MKTKINSSTHLFCDRTTTPSRTILVKRILLSLLGLTMFVSVPITANAQKPQVGQKGKMEKADVPLSEGKLSVPPTGPTVFVNTGLNAAQPKFPAGGVNPPQAVNNYAVIRTTSITYSSISGTGTSVASWRNGTSLDDNLSNSLPIGFTFIYNGGAYTQFRISTNGFMTFNTTSTATGAGTNPYDYHNDDLSASSASTTAFSPVVLAPMWDDLTVPAAGTLAGNIKYLTTGVTPNRVLTVEWIGMEVFANAGPDLNFQVKLYEADGHVEFIYGTMTASTATYSYTSGINAATLSATPTAAELLTQQTANTANFSNVASNALATIPATNTQITFTPPVTVPAAATSLTFPSIGASYVTLNWIDNATNEINYNVLISTDGGVTYQAFAAILAPNTTSATIFGLTASTTYFFRVIATTEGVASAPLDGSVTTAAPISGTKTIGPAGDYPSFTLAISDVNAGVGAGGVVFNVTAGATFTEDPPCITGGSAAAPVVFQKSGAGANPIIKPTGGAGTQDSGICILGGDFITFDGIDVAPNGAANTNIEFGALIFNLSATNGAQNDTIKNSKITLNRTNTSSIGINQAFSIAATAAIGTQSNNKYYNITIENASRGIILNGSSATVNDTANEIGVTGGGTTTIGAATANDIGNGSGSTYGIQAAAQSGVKIFNTEVRNVTGTSTGTVEGIVLSNTGSATGSVGTNDIFNNQIHDLRSTSASATSHIMSGIRANLTANAASVARIYNNFIYALDNSSTNTASRQLIGLRIQDGGSGAGSTFNVDFNSVRIAPTAVSCSNANLEIGTTTPVFKVRNNIFANLTGAQTTVKHYNWVSTSASSIGGAGSVSDRNDLYIANTTNGFIGLGSATDRATLANWQSQAAGVDANSQVNDPQFVSAANLHINTALPSIVESNGSFFAGAITWVNNDIDGTARNVTTPDIGADEGTFITPVANDAAAIALIDPAAGSFKASGAAFSPQASFENVGTATQVNVTVRYRIEGPSPATTEVYNQTQSIPTLTAGTGGAPVAVTFPSTSLSSAGTYTMFARTELAGDAIPSNDLITGTFDILPPLNGNYNVGAAQTAPFNSLTGAIIRLNALGVSGAVTLTLTDASYGGSETFPIIINPIAGSSATNTVTIKPATGVSPTISGSSASAMIILNGADWVIIDGNNGGVMVPSPMVPTRDMVIINTNPSTSSAVVWLQTTGGADPATNNTIKNLTLVGSGNTQTLVGLGSGSSTISITSLGTGNNNNTFQNNSISKTQYGIYSSGLSAATKNTTNIIADNAINTASPNNVATAGILVGFENNITISGNNISGVSQAGSPDVFGISAGFAANGFSTSTTGPNEVTNATITRNVIGTVVNTGTFSAVGIGLAAATSGTSLIANNAVSGVAANGTSGDFSGGIVLGGGTGSTTNVYFNSVSYSGTVAGSTAASQTAACLAVTASTAPTLDIRDNVFSNTQLGNTSATVKFASIALGYSSTLGNYAGLTSNYNDLYCAGAGPGTYQVGLTGGVVGTARTTLADWTTETGRDTPNSISANPGFVSTTDLHLALNSSPAANAGTPLGSVTVDNDGDSRSAAHPDIGADEILSNKLATLVLSTVPFSFNSNTFTYTPPSVAHNVTSTTVTPTAQDSNATITVNAVTVASGGTSAPIALAVGNTVITIVVTPEFGSAQTYTVTVTRAPTPVVTAGADSGPGTLRQALADAVDGDVITFGSFRPAGSETESPLVFSAVVTLTSAELVIDKNIVLDGGGASLTLVTRGGGAPAFRIFHVNPGHTVTIMRLSITNGAATGAAGGAIFNDTSSLSVDRCSITGNSADSSGAIQNSGTLVLLGSLLADNNATAGDGGAMRHDGSVMKITNSTISTNHATIDGGGIVNGVGHALSLGNCTLFKNTAGGTGGGIISAGTLNLRNSIIAYNTATGGGPNVVNSAGTATSGGYNLVSDAAGGNITDTLPGGPIFFAAGDQRNTDPMLGLRGNNAGQTEAYAPLVNSPAIDKGKDLDADGNPTSTDQRELSRPVDDPAVSNAPPPGDASDIGAVELRIGSHPIDAASMIQHGPGGPVYPIVLPLTGLPGVECRSGGAAGNYQVLIRFSTAITFTSGAAGAVVTNGTGSVTGVSRPEFISRGPNGGGTNVTIDLTGVTNAQTITVALLNVNGVGDNDIGVRMGMLLGDVDGNRLTNSTDVSSTQFESGHVLTGPPGNYRNDITSSGEINSSDVSSAQFYSGTGVPLPY
jgi:Cadherin-like beta sandwich domain/Fibronectin type III domain